MKVDSGFESRIIINFFFSFWPLCFLTVVKKLARAVSQTVNFWKNTINYEVMKVPFFHVFGVEAAWGIS